MLRTSFLLCTATVLVGACSTITPSSPASPQSESAPTAAEEQGPVEQAAQRIVSLAPSNTEIVFALGGGSQLVGRDSFSDFPAEASEVPDVGGGFTALNMELIVSAQPDLLLVSPLTPPEQIADLEKLGVPVQWVSNPVSFEELFANIASIGQNIGREAESQALVAALEARVQAVTEQVMEAESRPLVYYELDATDPSAPYTSGPGTFVDLLITSAGGENFGAELDGDWVQVSVEQLLARQPDVIVLGDYTYGGVTAEQLRARAGWDALSAVQQGQIHIFDDNLVSRPGPRLVDGLEAMAKLLHPTLLH